MVVITDVDIDYGKTFGPFPAVGHIPPSHFIGLLTADARTESTNITINPNEQSLGNTWLPYVHPARTQEEQNVEAYVKDRNIYYRMIRIIKAGEELFVWYSTDFAQQLGIQPVKRSHETVDNELLTCTSCGEKFKYPFPLMSHTRFRCTKQFNKPDTLDNETINNNFGFPMNSNSNVIFGKHRDGSVSKDIHAVYKQHQTGLKRSIDVEHTDNSRKKQYIDDAREENNNERLPSKLSPNSSDNDTEQRDVCSAFRKVEKSQTKDAELNTEHEATYIKSNTEDKLNSNQDEIIRRQVYPKQSLPYGLQGGLSMVMPNWMLPQSSSGQFYIDPRLYSEQIQTTTSEKMDIMNRIANLNNESKKHFSNTGMLGKHILMEQLRRTQYPYVQPANPMVEKLLSTTTTPELIQKPVNALNMAQNWCAKCNATFRMTSDLVYHMRSHHKREFDPMKRKREEKLQCNVCQETFKERHHLTRHMTSHS